MPWRREVAALGGQIDLGDGSWRGHPKRCYHGVRRRQLARPGPDPGRRVAAAAAGSPWARSGPTVAAATARIGQVPPREAAARAFWVREGSCKLRSTFVAFMASLMRPKYDGKYLRSKIESMLGNTRMRNTLTNIVIPTFDIQLLHPIIFSTYDAKSMPLKDALLSDVCISTSAAPTYLPPYYFQTSDADGKTREYNLIDGGVVATDPTLIAMAQIVNNIISKGKENIYPGKQVDCCKFRVVSIGTGSSSDHGLYTAKQSSQWGTIRWLRNKGMVPIVDIFMEASSGVVDIQAATLFQSCDANYLRIQDNSLRGVAATVDVATPENMQELIRIGERMLHQPVSRVDVETGKYVVVPGAGSNAEALARLARQLCEIRKSKLAS